MQGYIIGLLGMWLFCDSIISIRLYIGQSWLKDHSIRLIRAGIALFLMVTGLSLIN